MGVSALDIAAPPPMPRWPNDPPRPVLADATPPLPPPPADAAPRGPPVEPSLFMTVKEVCAFLKISPASFWRRQKAFDLRKLGARTLVSRASVEAVAANLPRL